MKNKLIYLAIAVLSLSLFAGCEAIGDIFSVGVWVGVIIVILIVGLIVFIAGKAKK